MRGEVGDDTYFLHGRKLHAASSGFAPIPGEPITYDYVVFDRPDHFLTSSWPSIATTSPALVLDRSSGGEEAHGGGRFHDPFDRAAGR